ncbi:MAG: hypothetical protein ACOZF0_17810 [Thermodesulfobacteriota bacterium]
MKVRRFAAIQLMLLVAVYAFHLPEASAIGLGFYGDVNIQDGSGDHSAEPDDYYNGRDEYRFETDDDNRSIGFVLDTALARNVPFNYRLNLGYGEWKWKNESGGKLELDTYTMDHTFGFRLYQDRLIRLWIGPQLRLSVSEGDFIDSSGVKDRDYEYSYVGIGVAPVIGVNFNPGDHITASLTIGYRFMRYYGDDDYKGGPDADYDYYESKYENDEKQVFMNLAFFFRLNDSF